MPLSSGVKGTYFSFLLAVVVVAVGTSIVFHSDSLTSQCTKDSSVWAGFGIRSSFSLAVIFLLQMAMAFMSSTLYDSFWRLKFGMFVSLLLWITFSSSTIFEEYWYSWFARVASFGFLLLQQIVLSDMANAWNEKWVGYHSSAVENYGDSAGPMWLVSLVVVSVLLYFGSLVSLGGMWWWALDGGLTSDSNRDNTDDVITKALSLICTTAVLCIGTTVIQLFVSKKEESCLLTSAVLTAFSTYLCFATLLMLRTTTTLTDACLPSTFQLLLVS